MKTLILRMKIKRERSYLYNFEKFAVLNANKYQDYDFIKSDDFISDYTDDIEASFSKIFSEFLKCDSNYTIWISDNETEDDEEIAGSGIKLLTGKLYTRDEFFHKLIDDITRKNMDGRWTFNNSDYANILVYLISVTDLNYIYDNIEFIIGYSPELYSNYSETINNRIRILLEKINNKYNIYASGNICRVINEDDENKIFKILVKCLNITKTQANKFFASLSSSESIVNSRFKYFLFSSKINYAEELLTYISEPVSEFMFHSTDFNFSSKSNFDGLNSETCLAFSNFNIDINRSAVNNRLYNFHGQDLKVNSYIVYFTKEERERLINIYDHVFGKYNLLSLLITFINGSLLDYTKKNFLVDKNAIMNAVNFFTNSKNDFFKNRSEKMKETIVEYLEKVENNVSPFETLNMLIEYSLTSTAVKHKSIVDNIKNELKLNDDQIELLLSEVKNFKKAITYNNSWSAWKYGQHVTLNQNEIAYISLLWNCIENKKLHTLLYPILSEALKLIVSEKRKPSGYTKIVIDLLHMDVKEKIDEDIFKKICKLIINMVMSNKTKKELLFGENISVNDDDLYPVSTYAKYFDEKIIQNQLLGYRLSEIATACLEDNPQLNDYLLSFLYKISID